MALTHNYLEPKFHQNGEEIVFTGKPPLAFHLAAVSCELLGISGFSVRLPSFFCGLLILVMIYLTARKLKNETTAVFAVLFCLSSVIFYLYSGLCMTDMVLAFSVCGAIFCYLLFTDLPLLWQKKLASIGVFVFLALGMLVKGPVAVVLTGLPVFFYILFYRKWHELKYHAWFVGPCLFLAISVPWYYCMSQKQPGFLQYFFIHENLFRFLFKEYGDRFGGGRETFRGMAIIWCIICNLPSLFLLVLPLWSRQFFSRFFSKDIFSNTMETFCFLTVVTHSLFWSLTSRVMLAYLLPTIPFFSLLIASRFEATGWFQKRAFLRYLSWSIPLSAFYIPLGFAAAAWCGIHYSDKMPAPFYRQAMAICSENKAGDCPATGDCPAKFYFASAVPHSADFYLHKNIVQHPTETAEESFKKSKSYYLIICQEEESQMTIPQERKLLLRSCGWSLYAPESNP